MSDLGLVGGDAQHPPTPALPLWRGRIADFRDDVYIREYGLGLVRGDAQHPQNRFFFVATITAGVDANGGQFAPFAPALQGKGRNTEDVGDFTNGEKIGEVFDIQAFFDFDGFIYFIMVCWCLIHFCPPMMLIE